MARKTRTRRHRSYDFTPEPMPILDLTIEEVMLDLDPAWALLWGQILARREKSSGTTT